MALLSTAPRLAPLLTPSRYMILTWLLVALWALHGTQSSSISNNQVQITRKLSSLRSYKDVQLFRFQIPDETSTATFRLNATQSEVAVNATVTTASNSSIPAPTTPAPPTYWPTIPPPTSKPPLINMTLLSVYTDKAVKFYRSFLTTACKKPLDVTFILRWGSLPLLSLKNATTPENFIFNDTANQYRIDLKTDGQWITFNLSNPMPGDWYGVAYLTQANDKIAQKGLEKECFYTLQSQLDLSQPVTPKPVSTLASSASSAPLKQSLLIDHHDSQPELLYKFYPGSNEFGAKIVIKNCQFRSASNLRHHQLPGPSSPQYGANSGNAYNDPNIQMASVGAAGNSSCPLSIHFRSLALPSSSQHDFTFACQSNHSSGSVEVTGSKCVIDLPTYAPNEWNYLQIVPLLTSELSSPYEPMRTKPIYGTVNFTIQLLLGQEAFLYSHFNDQQCANINGGGGLSPAMASAAGPTGFFSSIVSSTNNPVLSYPNSFGINKNNAKPVYGTLLTTAASVVVAPPEPNPVSHSKHEQESNPSNGGGSIVDHHPPSEVDEFEVNPHSNVVSSKPNSSSTSKTAETVRVAAAPASAATEKTPTAKRAGNQMAHANDDSIDYVEDGDDEETVDEEVERALGKSSLSQFAKRSADPGPQGGTGGGANRDRKKNERRKEGGRGQKKQKNKQGKKKQDALHDECTFDPDKILSSLEEDELANMTIVNLVNFTRYQSSGMFEFKYSNADLTLLTNQSEVPMVEVDNDRPSLLNFTVVPQFDIGGSLVISFAISPLTNNEHQNVTAILCLTHNRLPPIVSSSPGIRFDEFCYGHLVSNTSVANYTSEGSPVHTLSVPYPQPGTWYVSIVVRCFSEEETLEDPLLANVDYSGYSCDGPNKTSVYLDIQSSSCHNSRCLNGGKCMQYANGGILYSTCSCRAGWKGLICNDGSEALSEQKLLLNFLLLTISNSAFIPAIIVAACRRYFTESAIYLITMISSALYHACDSDYPQSYCVLNVGLLQFADFYTAVLSFFVTLITLANLSQRFKSFLHLMGAIAIALITQNDRTCLWTFVIPAGVATLLLFTCWCSQCCRRSCYPPGRCWIFSVCPALLLTIVGLIIYAFFETQENYAITHSIWHGIVALALLFAIPSMPSKAPAEHEEEDDERVHFMSSSSSSGAGSGKGSGGIQNAKSAHVEWRPPHTSFKFLHDDIDML